MTKKDKPLIYVAETSKILSKIICSQLEKLDYEVRLFTDGYILLKELIKSTPNIIIADKNLETIDGGELCNIIKTGSSKNDILFILISIEDKVYDFWSDSKLANKSMQQSLLSVINIELSTRFAQYEPYTQLDEYMILIMLLGVRVSNGSSNPCFICTEKRIGVRNRTYAKQHHVVCSIFIPKIRKELEI